MNGITEADIIAKYNEIIINAPIDEMDEALREIDSGLIKHLSTEAKNKINEYRGVGGQLMETITTEAEKLGVTIINGQVMNGEESIHLITPDRELITVIRIREPDDEVLEEIIGSE